MGITDKLTRHFPFFPFALHKKGLEQNRAPLPQSGGNGGYGGAGYDYTGDLLDAIRGVQVGRSKINFLQEAGDLRTNSIVSLCLGWMGTNWPQAPVRVGKINDGKPVGDDASAKHPVFSLLRRPNPNYRGNWLHWSLNSDWWTTGDAYCHVVTDGRNNLTGTPRELEWLPARLMTPKSDSTGRLSHYEYVANGNTRLMDKAEVIHFRFGVHPDNPLRGISPLLAQAAYLVADRCGAEYGAGLMFHGGLPPAILTPDSSGGAGTPPSGRVLGPDKAQELTDALNEGIQSEPGKIRFIGNAVKLLPLGFKPSEMTVNELMEMPETRVPAAFGIPPEVLKLRVGLLHSTENNIELSQRAAWTDCLGPTQDLFAEEWTDALLRERFGDENLAVFYDRSEVSVLKPNMNAAREVAAKLFVSRVIDRSDAKTTGGFTPLPEDVGVYYADAVPADPTLDSTNPGKTPGEKPQKKTLIDTR